VTRFPWTAAVGFLVVCGGGALVPADPDTKDEGAFHATKEWIPGPPHEHLVYTNDDGTFGIGAGKEVGEAAYDWKGDPRDRYHVKLTYVGRSVLRGGGTEEDGWIYQEADGHGHGKLWFFAENPLPGRAADGRRPYALYYSTDRDPDEATFHRYLTRSGTTRP
jgi:hypothetical protein